MADNDYPLVSYGAPVDPDEWYNAIAEDLTEVKARVAQIYASAAVATRSSQSIPHATVQPVTFDVEAFDNDGIVTVPSAVFTFQRAGMYRVSAAGTWGTISATGYRLLLIYFNGVETVGQENNGDASASIRTTTTDTLVASVGDTVELRAFHTLGVAQNLNSAKLAIASDFLITT